VRQPVRQVMAASDPAEPAVGVTMEEVVGRRNLQRALKRVCANQGSPGVDGMTVDQLKAHLRTHWPAILQRLLDGQYTPEPVKQVLIPKPDGSSRTLGIPTVVDRFIQQALLQALTPKRSGQLDSPEAALLYDEAVDQELPHPVPAAEITWRQRTRRRRYRSLPQGAVGTVERQTAESGIVEPLLCREGPVFPP